jgi:Transcriptional regulators
MNVPPVTPEAGPPRRTTLKDIARESGYHITTVSLALREHASIPPQTRARIKEIATRLGYERDPVFHALSRFRQQGSVCAPAPRIAYLENYRPMPDRTRPPYLQMIFDGARRQAQLLGYELEPLMVGEDDHDSRSLARHLRENKITGIVIAGFVPGFAEIALNWDEFAVAKIHSRHTGPDAPTIGNDHIREVRLAFRRLTELGYQRIGMAVGRADEDACGHRHSAGFLMEEASIPPERRVPPLLFPYNSDAVSLGGMIGRWVRRHQIDAVLCNWANIRELLEDDGLQVPNQVACACLCLSDSTPPGLAGIRPHLPLLGERAVSIVVTQLKSGERGIPEFAPSLYVQSVWQDGETAPVRG